MTVSTEATVYASDRVLVMAANQLIEGRPDSGEFVTISASAADYTVKRGSDGPTVFSRTNNRGKTVKVKVMQTSRANTILTQLRALGLASPNGAPFLFEVRDLNNGALVVSSAKSMIMSDPDMPYGAEVGDREWTIECASADSDASGYPAV